MTQSCGWLRRCLDQVASTLKDVGQIRDEYNLIGYGPTKGAKHSTAIVHIAMTLVRWRRNPPSPTPNVSRILGSRLDSLKLQLFSEAPLRRPGIREAGRFAGIDDGGHGRGQ